MIELVRYHTHKKVQFGYESSVRLAIIKRGRKWMKVLALDANKLGGLKLWKVALAEEKYMTPVLHKGKPYPLARALTGFRRLAKSHGASKGAKKLMKEARNQ